MPIHVDIKINDNLIETLHIGRMESLRGTTETHNYLVVRGKNPDSTADWHKRGFVFNHRYSDGALICVMLAVEALEDVGEAS